MRQLGLDGAWECRLEPHDDPRGTFVEWFPGSRVRPVLGDFTVAQANCSVSRRGVLRGVHFTDVPPGQAKYVTCVAGRVLDVIVDVRLGSPTFGQAVSVELGGSSWRAVYLAEGLGHAFVALTDQATVIYLCSTTYVAGSERAIHPLDPELALPWPADLELVLSARDQAAPTLREARKQGWLPVWQPQAGQPAGARS